MGRSFSHRAQPHVYEELNLTAVLLEAHPKLLPGDLEFAEEDGVFDDAKAPGLFFLMPSLWNGKDGYKARLKAWREACEHRAGGLASRTKSPERWEDWSWAWGQPSRGGGKIGAVAGAGAGSGKRAPKPSSSEPSPEASGSESAAEEGRSSPSTSTSSSVEEAAPRASAGKPKEAAIKNPLRMNLA